MLTVGVLGTIAPRNAGQRLPVPSRKAERKQQLFCMVDYARPGVASRPQRAPTPSQYLLHCIRYRVPGRVTETLRCQKAAPGRETPTNKSREILTNSVRVSRLALCPDSFRYTLPPGCVALPWRRCVVSTTHLARAYMTYTHIHALPVILFLISLYFVISCHSCHIHTASLAPLCVLVGDSVP